MFNMEVTCEVESEVHCETHAFMMCIPPDFFLSLSHQRVFVFFFFIGRDVRIPSENACSPCRNAQTRTFQ